MLQRIRTFCPLLLLMLLPSLCEALELSADCEECVRWAAEDLTSALRLKHIDPASAEIVLSIRAENNIEREGFSISRENTKLSLRASDSVGAMYGLLELTEQIRNCAATDSWPQLAAAIESTQQKPSIELRADNFYCHVSPLLFLDVEMWQRYIDMLARNRFNMIDIHGGYELGDTEFRNLYPLLVHVPGYPSVGNAAEQARNLDCLKAIVAHARNRGVKVALMNYDTEVAGLDSSQTRDYTVRAVAELLKEVPGLQMLGFRIGESGANAEFFEETFVKGLALSGRKDVEIYTRTWKADKASIVKIAQQLNGKLDVEIKYNGEQLGLPYQALHGTHLGQPYGSYSYQDYLNAPTPYRVIWQIRANGTHRYFAWEDSKFIRRTLRTMSLGNARGFSLEPHCAYLPTYAAEYFRSARDKALYRYIWEKHWMWYFAWGRLAYNAALPESTIQAEYRDHFGSSGDAVHRAFQNAGPIVPMILAYRFQGPDQRDYSPETETGCWLDSESEQSFLQSEPMDARSFVSIQEFTDAAIHGVSDGRVTPPQVVRILQDAAKDIETEISKIDAIENEHQWSILKHDLLAQAALARYYADRIRACTHLAYALKTGSQSDYDKSLKLFESSRAHWTKLAGITDRVYAPLDNPLRAQRKFQWSCLARELDACDSSNPASLWGTRKPDPNALPLEWDDSSNYESMELNEVDCASHGGRIDVSCHPKQRDHPAGVILWYKPFPSQYAWQSTSMHAEPNGSYTASVSDDSQGMLYKIEVQATAKHSALFPNPLQERPYWILEPSKTWEPAEKSTHVQNHR